MVGHHVLYDGEETKMGTIRIKCWEGRSYPSLTRFLKFPKRRCKSPISRSEPQSRSGAQSCHVTISYYFNLPAPLIAPQKPRLETVITSLFTIVPSLSSTTGNA